MSFAGKRDRIQVIAEILKLCKNPQTQTSIRHQTNISYVVLQSCVMQLLVRRWLEEVEARHGQRKLAITEKGAVFLGKWMELQDLTGLNGKRKLHAST